MKMLDPRLYVERDYIASIGGTLYGGKMRRNAEPLQRYGRVLEPLGSSLQLLALAGWTSAFWLHTVRQPTLIMMGIDDPIIPVVNGQLLAALIPRARVVTIDDGHLFLLTSARECAPIIAEFLSDKQSTHASTNGAAALSGGAHEACTTLLPNRQ
jgi:pimeloyl-ACP methyl ester carboxylesterase